MTVPLALHCRSVSHWFGRKRVLHDVEVRVPRGQFLSLVGPSGCGKSTLLRGIVGTHLPCEGEVLIWRGQEATGEAVTGPGRDRGIVYQHYSLYPFLSAVENVAVGLMLDQTSIPFRVFQWPQWRRLRKQHLAEAEEMLAKVKLGDALRMYPHEMSGGMRQRVALAQALIMKPEIILLDEPFGALDEATREDLQKLLLSLHAENQQALGRRERPAYTLIIVTHELNEALLVGDRVVGLSQYWDWGAENHEKCPGATITYDKPSPIFKPDNARELEEFVSQREEIRRVVFHSGARFKRGEYHQPITPPPMAGV
ncbi:MAG: ABC transporter ATP-binding protein [Verrucomicrobiales bacterium]|nr:ABC transporter ATP-binding protein [Verrucomicrobiales bacterium]